MNIYIIISSILVAISIYGILSSRNIIRILISIEILFNAVILIGLGLTNSIAFALEDSIVSNEHMFRIMGSIIVFSIGLAVAEIVVVFAILMSIFKFGILKRVDTRELPIEKG